MKKQLSISPQTIFCNISYLLFPVLLTLIFSAKGYSVATCINNSSCNDGNVCTYDTCMINQPFSSCGHLLIAGCCNTNAQCADADVCTADTCEGNQCTHTAIPFCCHT